MKKRDWSKVIGIIGRGGLYGASNETSEEKLKRIFPGKWPLIFRREELVWLCDEAARRGFKILVFHRGLNR